jgi:hypothetical protein
MTEASNVLQKINLMLSTTNTTFLNTWYNAGATDLITHNYANSTTTRNLCIGARIDSIAPGFHLNGSVSEVIVWQLDYTSTKSGIESNVQGYFNM